MTQPSQNQRPESLTVELLPKFDLYLLSMGSGIALNKNNTGYLQAYLDAVWQVCADKGITDVSRKRRIAFGAKEELADEVREEAIAMVASGNIEAFAPYHDIEMRIEDPKYKKGINALTKEYTGFLMNYELKEIIAYDQLTREAFALHGAMMLEGATGMRKYYLGSPELDQDAVVAHLVEVLNGYKDTFEANYKGTIK